MTDYRVYRLDKAGRIFGPPDVLTCDDDETVIEKAAGLTNYFGIEVWDLSRLVIRLPKHVK